VLSVSVPGLGAAGSVGAFGVLIVLLTVACFVRVAFAPEGVAAKLTIASEMPAVQSKIANRRRELMKPEFLEEEFFFMLQFPLFFQKEGSPNHCCIAEF
jgi:hypothetical protein